MSKKLAMLRKTLNTCFVYRVFLGTSVLFFIYLYLLLAYEHLLAIIKVVNLVDNSLLPPVEISCTFQIVTCEGNLRIYKNKMYYGGLGYKLFLIFIP